MRLKLTDLRSLSDRLFSHLEEAGHQEVEIVHDYYWHVPKELRYDPYDQPTDLELGQLSDDWSELQRIHRGDGEALGYALVWLASILQAVGEDIVE